MTNLPPMNDSSLEQIVNSITSAIDHVGGNINMQRDRPYTGQSWTDSGTRGATEISGITFRDLRDCYIRAVILSHSFYKDGTLERLEPNATLIEEANKGPDAALCENDIYQLVGDCDLLAIQQNLSCEIEKIMGIFPNTKGLTLNIEDLFR
jgi:hypothetical protein